MPSITIIKCRNCGLSFPGGWGYYSYAVDDNGKRVVCAHPAEFRIAEQVTHMKWDDARAVGRIGLNSFCMCFSCSHQFDLDLDRDIKRCPKCGSLEVRSARGALGSKCPSCRKGVFYEKKTSIET